MPTRTRLILLFLLVGGAMMPCAFAQPAIKSSTKRAKPPTFDPAKTAEYFFDDVFGKLIGERPKLGPVSQESVADRPAATPPVSTAAPQANSVDAGWTKLISATTLEDEIKAIKLEVDRTITTPANFAGGGHKVIRREFSILAMLLGVIAEYGGEVRFKRDAAAARDLFAKAANNAKAGGNTNVYAEAKQRKLDLAELVNGSSLEAPAGEGSRGWNQVIARAPLMQRLEIAFQNRLSPALSNPDAFAKNSDLVRQQAELITVMARVLAMDGMDDADDTKYVNFATSMKDAAAGIVDAVKLKSYDQARAMAGRIDKACAQCHESYR